MQAASPNPRRGLKRWIDNCRTRCNAALCFPRRRRLPPSICRTTYRDQGQVSQLIDRRATTNAG